MHVAGAHAHYREPIFFQNLGAFDHGTNGLRGGGAWGSSRFEDHFRLMS